MSIFRSEDFKGMEFDPFTKADVLEAYPRLQTIKEFKEFRGKKNILRYVIFLYDHQSPLKEKIKKLEERKAAAMELAQVKKDQVSFEDEGFANLVLAYLRFQDDKTWSLLCVHEEMFDECLQRLVQPIDRDLKDTDIMTAMEKKKKISAIAEDYRKQIAQYEKDLMGDDTDLVEASRQKIKYTPESVANLG